MRVIGVLDLAAGQAVHARAGNRSHYRPVQSALLPTAGDAVALARAYREQLGVEELYIADLDALEGDSVQWELIRALCASGVRASMVDIGVQSAATAVRVLECGATRVIVPLETLPAFQILASIVRTVGAERVVFSLDLRDGLPLVRQGAPPREPPLTWLAHAVDAGITASIILDLARVGGDGGPEPRLVGEARRRYPALELLAGGGVRDRGDIERLAAEGCDGALVATALLEQRLGRADIEALGASAPRTRHPIVSR